MSLPPPSLPPPQPGPPGPPPAGAPTPPVVPSAGMGGCAKAVIALVVVVGILGAAGMVAALVGLRWLGGKAEDALSTKDCPFLSNDGARAVLGDGAKAEQLGAFLEGTLGIVLDSRVLADAPSCFVTSDTIGSARVAKADAGRSRYSAERENANALTEDRGGGLSVTREGWFASEVDGLGDEAFCTSPDLAGAVGVLVRDGGTLVYASIQPLAFDQEQIVVDEKTGAILNPTLCAQAQDLARAVLRS